jgi:Holliday junction resolvase RusA-like endonuclease
MKHDFSITYSIDPKPTPRIRVARNGGRFYPKEYQEYKQELERLTELLQVTPTGDDYRLSMKFFFAKPKKTKKVRPKGDLDNLAKGVLDALTGHVFIDDDQVTSITLEKEWTDAVKGWIRVTVS